MLRNALLTTSRNGISQDRFGKERDRLLFEGKQTQTVVACEVKVPPERHSKIFKY